MAVNPDWQRWIWASVCKHFNDNKGSLNLFVEGQERHTREKSSWIELRMDGPQYHEMSIDYFRIYIEINVLIQACLPQRNFYSPDVETGQVVALFPGMIPIYKLPASDLLGCMQLMTSYKKEGIQVFRLGQIEPRTQLIHNVVEAHYEMFLGG